MDAAVSQPTAEARGLFHPVDAAPAAGRLCEVAPGVYWAAMPIPFPPRHVNVWLLADGEGWTAVDTGYGSGAARECWEEILSTALGGRAVTRVLVTHCHPDHIGNAAWLARRFGLLPWMTHSEYLLAHAAHGQTSGSSRAALLDLNERHGLERARLEALHPPGEGYRRGVPELPAAFHRIKDGESIAIGGRAWQVMVGYGHSPEHASLYCPALDVLISGDMLLPRISTNVSVWPMQPEADPVGEFLDSLARTAALPGDVLVLPSHGLPFRGARARVAELEAHHRRQLATILAACGEPRTAAELLPALYARDFTDYHIFFAMGETVAHLNYLMHRGALERSAGPVHRFRRGAAAQQRG